MGKQTVWCAGVLLLNNRPLISRASIIASFSNNEPRLRKI